MIEAALGGLGAAMAPFVMLGDEVARGRLIAPLGFDPDGTEYGLIAPRTEIESVGLTALCDWLVQQAVADATGYSPA